MKRATLIPVLGLASLLGLAIAPSSAAAQAAALSSPASAPAPEAPPPPPPHAVQLDHVVAAIGNNVILESDVRQEMRFSALEPIRVLPGENSPDLALRRLIDRSLILEQMKEQQQPVTTAGPKVAAAIAKLRGEIPACAQYHCETSKGWDAFLRAHDLTPQMVQQRWSQRIAILRFIDLRFRSGIRVSNQQISDYYRKTLVPALAKEHESAPSLDKVSSRIREVLLQQQVSGLFSVWLENLRDQGNVRIVDPAYSADLKPQSSEGSE